MFLQLISTFLLIGLLTFGGGYAMIALIQDQVVLQHHWLSATQFADILAISQVTPGPVGINTATFTGYTVALQAGYPQAVAVLAALLASLAVLALPLTLILLVGRWLAAHRQNPYVAALFPVLRLVVIGLIAAAAISLMPTAFAPVPNSVNISILNSQFSIFNLIIFAVVFTLSVLPKKCFSALHSPLSALQSPIALIILTALAGLLLY
ncbi:MAG: chromate transporter [Bacteroidales bacterium]|nr:chromate transporter [Bacteroidales bacterium]